MNSYLLVDDTPYHLKPLTLALREAGHEIAIARDLCTAWGLLTRGNRFDLVIIDIALDQGCPEFAAEASITKQALVQRSLADLPISGQAMGLRLWQQRQTLKQPYCYISNHPQIWVPNLVPHDKEFEAGTVGEVASLVLDKSTMWASNVQAKLQAAIQHWDDKKWLA
jgi:CheY-like chemotaxis protein